MNYSQYRRTKKEWIKLIFIWLSVSVSLGILFYRDVAGIAVILPFGIIYERLNRRKALEKRRNELSYQFVEFLQVAVSSLKAGTSLERAVTGAKERLGTIYGREDMIIKEIALMESGLRMNINIEDILYDFGKRSGIEDINQFAEVCKLAKRAGGNLIKIMEHTVGCIVCKINVEKEIQSIISGKKLESRLMTAILPLILLYINFAMADMAKKLYHNLTGVLLMTAVLILYAVCYLWFEKITDIKV